MKSTVGLSLALSLLSIIPAQGAVCDGVSPVDATSLVSVTVETGLTGRPLLVTGTSEPFEYLYRSIQEWYAPEEFAGLLCAAGFEGVSYRMMGLGTVALHTGCKPIPTE